jgi:AbrB family looped-hinge helix DNA binding protein
MSTATLTSKGQTTIPKDIRDRLRLKAGDRLDFVLQPDGGVLMVPATIRARELKGLLPRPKKPVSLEQMERTIRDAAVSRTRRGR